MRGSTRGLSIAAGRFLNDFSLHAPQAEVASGEITMHGDMATFELKKPGSESRNGNSHSSGGSPKPRRRRRTKAEMEAARAAAKA